MNKISHTNNTGISQSIFSVIEGYLDVYTSWNTEDNQNNFEYF